MDSNIISLEKIRNNAIDMLIERKYDKNTLQNLHTFNHAEFIKSYKNNAININVKHEDKNEICIVYFYNYRDKRLKKEDINMIIDSIKGDMKDTFIYNLILVVREKPHSLILKRINSINNNDEDDDYDLKNLNVEIFYHNELIINITKHERVPIHIVLNESEKNSVLDIYKCNPKQIPQYAINDPIVKYYGLKNGDMFKIIRKSQTSGNSIYYRIVNKNVTI
jgi:DNA-directed RNA polymerase subunit H (RpoH/RPB5)